VGGAEIDVIKLATMARDELRERGLPLQVAVMGCVVNGPGEAREADLGLAAGRSGAHLFVKGSVVRVIKLDKSTDDSYRAMVDELVEEAERVAGEGVEKRLEQADAVAAAEAEREAAQLRSQKIDPNKVAQRTLRIRAITKKP